MLQVSAYSKPEDVFNKSKHLAMFSQIVLQLYFYQSLKNTQRGVSPNN
jgi:hypothetical protein